MMVFTFVWGVERHDYEVLLPLHHSNHHRAYAGGCCTRLVRSVPRVVLWPYDCLRMALSPVRNPREGASGLFGWLFRAKPAHHNSLVYSHFTQSEVAVVSLGQRNAFHRFYAQTEWPALLLRLVVQYLWVAESIWDASVSFVLWSQLWQECMRVTHFTSRACMGCHVRHHSEGKKSTASGAKC